MGWSVQILRHRMGNPGRLFRTVRHLRAGQVVNRITRKFSSPSAVGRPTPATRPPKSIWKSCPGRLASMLSPTRFRFIGQEAELATAGDWNGLGRARLWLFNLHYFDDLRAQGAADRLQWHRDLIGRWLVENPPTTGNGWEPYPTSLRIVNWIAWALAGMTHPDGEIGFCNDAAFGIARTHAELAGYAASFGIAKTRHAEALRVLDASGYLRLQSGPFWVIFDAAEIGPSYLPGHGHADVLSLEVSLDGQRLVVNSGTSTYENDTVRIEERSTAAHATVEIDRHSSSEVWASFRVGRRARPFDLSTATKNGVLSAAASHDGYRWLPGKPIHRRDIAASPEALRIIDRISGTGEHSVRGRFPLHPSARSVSQQPTGWRVESASGRMVRVQVHGASE